MRKARAAVPAAARRAAADETAAAVPALPGVREADAVCVYVSVADELGTRPLLAALLARGPVWVPRVGGAAGVMAFHRVERPADLVPGRFGVPTAPAGAPVLEAAGLRVAVLVPGLAFDAGDRVRLGMGGGYYDRALARLRKGAASLHTIGLAYRAQVVADVPRDAWDVAMDQVWSPREA